MEIRYITDNDDRLDISQIYEESWKYAYKGMIPQSFLDQIPHGRWATNLDQNGRQTLVAVEDGKMFGTCSFGRSRFQEYADYGEIIAIYFLPEFMGKGYGKKLLRFAMDELEMQGYQNVFLWVLEDNIRARRFYEKMGFQSSDIYLDDNIGGKQLREVHYCYYKDMIMERPDDSTELYI